MTCIAPLRWCDLSPFHENALLRTFVFCTLSSQMQQRALNDLCRIVELSAKLLTAQLEGPRLAEVQKLLAEKNVGTSA
jgi:hypothetical protein